MSTEGFCFKANAETVLWASFAQVSRSTPTEVQARSLLLPVLREYKWVCNHSTKLLVRVHSFHQTRVERYSNYHGKSNQGTVVVPFLLTSSSKRGSRLRVGQKTQ